MLYIYLSNVADLTEDIETEIRQLIHKEREKEKRDLIFNSYFFSASAGPSAVPCRVKK